MPRRKGTGNGQTSNPAPAGAGGGDLNFLTDHRVRSVSPYLSLVGDSTAQNVFQYVGINAFVKEVGTGVAYPRSGNTAPFGVWYNIDVDSVLAAEMFAKIRNKVRGTIPYGPSDVQAYNAAVAKTIAMYTYIRSTLDQLDAEQDELGEVNSAMEALNSLMFYFVSTTAYSSSLAESNSLMGLIRGAFDVVNFPPMWREEIQRIYQWHRVDMMPDSPLCAFKPVQTHGWSTASAAVLTSMASPTYLWSAVRRFTQDPIMMKISADIETAFGEGWAVNLPESIGKAGFDLGWTDLWAQSGWIFDDANVTDPNDSMVPNGSNAGEDKRYMLPYNLAGGPTELLVKNMAWGFGDQVEEIRGLHLANYFDPDNKGDIDWSTKATHAYAYFSDNPIRGGASPGVGTVDVRVGLPGTPYAQTEYTAMVEELMRNSMFTRGYLGWTRTIQAVNSTQTDDQFEGVTQMDVYVGKKFYVEPFALQTSALNGYLSMFGL